MNKYHKAFVYTFDVLIAVLLVGLVLTQLPVFSHKKVIHNEELYAQSLLSSAGYSGILEQVTRHHVDARHFVRNVSDVYCSYIQIYRIRLNKKPKLIYTTYKSGCSNLPETYYQAVRTVMWNNANPPNARRVYAVRLIIWPKLL